MYIYIYILTNFSRKKRKENIVRIGGRGEMAAGGEVAVVRISGVRGEMVGGAATWCGAVMWGVKIKLN
jgi:hypothetical protein